MEKCTRCNRPLTGVRKPVWLELSNTNGQYYGEGRFPEGHVSQGGFPFGEACAMSQCIDTAMYFGGLPQNKFGKQK